MNERFEAERANDGSAVDGVDAPSSNSGPSIDGVPSTDVPSPSANEASPNVLEGLSGVDGVNSTAHPSFGGAFGHEAQDMSREMLGGGQTHDPEAARSSSPDRDGDIGTESSLPRAGVPLTKSPDGGVSGGGFDPAKYAHGSPDAVQSPIGDAGGPDSPQTPSDVASQGGQRGGNGSASKAAADALDGEDSQRAGANSPVAGVGNSLGDGVMPAAPSAPATPASTASQGLSAGAGDLGAMLANGASGIAFGGVQLLRGGLSLLGRGGSSLAAATGGRISSFGASALLGGAGSLATAALVVPMLVGGPNVALEDDGVDVASCGQLVKNAASAFDGSAAATNVDKDARALDNAKKIYSVMKTKGASNEAIAGALGNIDVESNVDSTGVETIFDEPFQIGPKKKHAQDVGFDIKQIDAGYAARFPAIKTAGIGLIGFTNSNNTGLQAYAKAHGKSWSDAGVQIAYMYSHESSFGANMDKLSSTSFGSPSEASDWFQSKIEGNPGMMTDKRRQAAAGWMAKLGDGWTVDSGYAKSILDQAGTATLNAGQDGVSTAAASCRSATGTNGNNSSLAQAAVSYAWPFYDQSVNDITKGQNNRGTPLYQNLHLAIWKSNNYATNPLASCDNGVSTAVQWSGADKDFPEQSSNVILDYLKGAGTNSGVWREIPWDDQVSTLQPGDILSKYGHVLMYVGKDIPLKFYNGDKSKFEPDGDMVSASHSGNGGATTPNKVDRSPGIGVTQRGAPYYTKADGYHVFRLVKKTGSEFESLKPSSTVVESGGSGK